MELSPSRPPPRLATISEPENIKILRTCCTEALYLRHLPPLVVTGVGHVENVPVVEAEAAARQPVVPVRVVLEQRAHVERPLGAGAHERARDVLLQLVQARLVPVVLVRLVLHTQLHHAARALQHLDHTHWVKTTPKAVNEIMPMPIAHLGVKRLRAWPHPGGLLVRGAADVGVVHGQDLVSASQPN